MAKLYKKGDTYYRMVCPAGTRDLDGYEHYALWQPVKKWLLFWVKSDQCFWSDPVYYEEVV